jgi:hypothetical protein
MECDRCTGWHSKGTCRTLAVLVELGAAVEWRVGLKRGQRALTSLVRMSSLCVARWCSSPSVLTLAACAPAGSGGLARCSAAAALLVHSAAIAPPTGGPTAQLSSSVCPLLRSGPVH